MDHHERARREDPERGEPIRSWRTIYRGDPESGRDGGDAPSGARPVDDAIARAVDLGYRVVEEHIRQGSDHAGTRDGQAAPPSSDRSDILRIFQRMLRCYMDLGALWMEVADNVLGNPQLTESLLRKVRSVTGEEGESHRGHGVTMEIESARRLEVDLALDGPAAGSDLAVHALRSLDDAEPAIRGVAFLPGADGAAGRLLIQVDADQPPGAYTGVIVERATNRSRGSLTVRVLD